MYLWDINKRSREWPNDPKKAIEYFHKKVTLKTLKDFVDEVGVDKFEKLQILFPEFRNCGFKLDEIMNKDHKLLSLNRKGYGSQDPTSDSIGSYSD